ncbi:hypothetical protein VZT92_010972 [Zoarces viviparus]|uniref:Uncharacterized protein n=1 Tax=Zoarces viviparus TaxID=48416 RepID=A0AAW1F9X3_ZOAVI
MRGERRSASFRKEKPAGLSRALSWLNVSTLSRQSRRIFHSQNDLRAAHNHRQPYSHARFNAEDEDHDSWVYQPQHKIGERGQRNDETSYVTACCISSSRCTNHMLYAWLYHKL